MDDDTPIELPKTQKRHREWALALCDPENPRRHHYAMMELGQTICRPGTPLCEACPVARFCKTSAPETLPVKKKRAPMTEISEHAIWMRDGEGRILLHRESGNRRTGLWKLPLRTEETCAPLKLILRESYPITRYKVTLNIHEAAGDGNHHAGEGDEWIEAERLASLPMAAPFRRAVTQLLSDF